MAKPNRDPQTEDSRIKEAEDALAMAIRLNDDEDTIIQLRDSLLWLREQKNKQREDDQEQ